MGFQVFYCQGPPNIMIYNRIYTNIPLWVTHFLKYTAKDKGRKESLHWKLQHKRCFLALACKIDHWPQNHPIVVRVCDKHLTLRSWTKLKYVSYLYKAEKESPSFSLRQRHLCYEDGVSHNLFIFSISVFLHCTRACCYGNSVQVTAQ